MWTQTQLREAFHAAGLRGGDTVLVHSALRKLGPVEGGADTVGEDLRCCTLFHGCEEWAGVPWAVSPKPVRLYSITASGEVIPVSLHHHVVRSWDVYPRLEPDLVAAGMMRIHSVGSCQLRLLDARATADWLVARLRKDPSILCP